MSQAEHRQYCEQLAQAGNPLFRLSRIFSGADDNALVSLHALFACIQQIGMSISDDDVARRKLQWWFEESRADQRRVSHHPVWREINRAGAGERIAQASLDRLLVSTQSRLERPAISDLEALELCSYESASPLVELEAAEAGLELDLSAVPRRLVVRRGLWLLICESFLPKGNGSPWWMPLNMLARAGLSRRDLESGSGRELFRELLTVLVEDQTFARPEYTDISEHPVAARHLFVLDSLIGQSLRRLPRAKSMAVGKLGFSGTIAAWRTARRFSHR